MSLFSKTRSARRPRNTIPTLEPMESICLLSAMPGLAHAKAALQPAMHVVAAPSQPITNQARTTLRAAGIPFNMQSKMGRNGMLANYQKALDGTKWEVRYRQPLRHIGPYLVEVPAAKPDTPGGNQGNSHGGNHDDNHGDPPAKTPIQTTLNPPTLAAGSVTTDGATITLTAGPGGAPFGVLVHLMPLSAYHAAGDQFAGTYTETRLDTPLAEGQAISINYPDLKAGTQYVAEAVAMPGTVTTPKPGHIYRKSDPSTPLGFATQAVVQLESPTLATVWVDLDSANIAVTIVGPAGAPFGIEVRMATLAEYTAAGNQIPSSATVTTLDGPFDPGEAVYLEFPGLQQGTEYVVQAVARAGSSATPAPGVEYIQSDPSSMLVLKTEHEIRLERPLIRLGVALPSGITVGLNAHGEGAPGGWAIEYTTYQDYFYNHNGWANATKKASTRPLNPYSLALVDISGLQANTIYIVRAQLVGSGLVISSTWSDSYFNTPLVWPFPSV